MADADDIVSGVLMGIGFLAFLALVLVYTLIYKKKNKLWSELKDRLLSSSGYRVPMLEAVVGPEDYKEYIETLIEENGESALLATNRRDDENFNVYKMHDTVSQAGGDA